MAQISPYRLVDQVATSKINEKTVKSLASALSGGLIRTLESECTHNYLVKKAFTWENLARLAFRWIAENIQYDTTSSPTQSAENVLVSQKGKCGDYAILFESLCLALGFPQRRVCVIGGHSPIESEISVFEENHAWNAVDISSSTKPDWRLVDCTWGAGYVQTKKFLKKFDDDWFFGQPSYWILQHFPKDSEWQLLQRPLAWNEWMIRPKVKPCFITYGLSFVVPQDNREIISTSEKVVLVRMGAKDVILIANLYTPLGVEDSSGGNVRVIGRSNNGTANVVDVVCVLTSFGSYCLILFVKRNTGQVAKECCRFNIDFQPENK